MGRLALIIPVITSTRGDWVASTRWMPTARAFWARRMIESSNIGGRHHHQVGQLVDHAQDVGAAAARRACPAPVELGQRTGAGQGHDP